MSNIFCIFKRKNKKSMICKTGYHEFFDEDKAKEFQEEVYGDYCKEYLLKERKIKSYGYEYRIPLSDIYLKAYLGYTHADINEYLRTGEYHDQECARQLEALIDKLNELLILAPRVPYNIVVYRGISDDSLNKMLNIQSMYNDIYMDEAFLSTSLLKQTVIKEFPSYDNILKIYVPKNAYAMGVDGATDRKEFELLFPSRQYLNYLGKEYDRTSNKRIYEYELMNLRC